MVKPVTLLRTAPTKRAATLAQNASAKTRWLTCLSNLLEVEKMTHTFLRHLPDQFTRSNRMLLGTQSHKLKM